VTPLLVAAGAAAGAALRFWVGHHLDDRTPWGTLIVNAAGSFVLGLLIGAEVSTAAMALLGTGWCGGLTTYSAFSVQARDLVRDRGPAAGAAYGVGTIALAVAACTVGLVLAGSAG
jgi:fluoride exporter